MNLLDQVRQGNHSARSRGNYYIQNHNSFKLLMYSGKGRTVNINSIICVIFPESKFTLWNSHTTSNSARRMMREHKKTLNAISFISLSGSPFQWSSRGATLGTHREINMLDNAFVGEVDGLSYFRFMGRMMAFANQSFLNPYVIGPVVEGSDQAHERYLFVVPHGTQLYALKSAIVPLENSTEFDTPYYNCLFRNGFWYVRSKFKPEINRNRYPEPEMSEITKVMYGFKDKSMFYQKPPSLYYDELRNYVADNIGFCKAREALIPLVSTLPYDKKDTALPPLNYLDEVTGKIYGYWVDSWYELLVPEEQTVFRI